jgi:hypothetical protein
VSHALAHPHGLSLIDLKHNLKFQGKPKYPVSQTRWFNFDKIQSSLVAHASDGDRANLHPSGIWEREGRDRG